MKELRCILLLTFLFIVAISCGPITGQEIGVEWVVPPIMEVDNFEISPSKDDSRFVVEKNKLSGVCDRNGNIVIPIEYVKIRMIDNYDWILAHHNYRTWYLFNQQGENIGLPYDKYVTTGKNTAVVSIDNKYGLINTSGEELVPIKYEKYGYDSKFIRFQSADGDLNYKLGPNSLSPNTKRVNVAKQRSVLANHYYISKGKRYYGFLNMDRDTVVPLLYLFKGIHPDGYLIATFDGNTWGVIDTLNNTLYPFTADRMGKWTDSGLLPVRYEKEWALLRFPEAEIVIPFGEYDKIEVYDPRKDIFTVTIDGLDGLIDTKRNVILPCKYEYISSYTHITTQLNAPNKRRGYWNRPSDFIQEPVYAWISNLNDTLVVVKTDSTQAVVNSKTGEVIIPFSKYQLDRVGVYFDSHKKYNFNISRTDGGHLHGLYDRQGNLIFPHDSTDIVVVPEDNSYWLIPHYKDSKTHCEQRSRDGEVLRTIPKLGADLRKRGFVVTHIRNSNGQRVAKQICYYNSLGEEQYYTRLDGLTENLHRVKVDSNWGFTDADGKVVVPIVFDAAKPSADGYIRVKYNGKWGVIQNPKFDYFQQFERKIKY